MDWFEPQRLLPVPDSSIGSDGLRVVSSAAWISAPEREAVKGIGGADVVEIVNSDPAGTYRAIYTVRFAEVIYVLHAFQKKSRHGVKTDQRDITLVKQRLKLAEAVHERWLEEMKGHGTQAR